MSTLSKECDQSSPPMSQPLPQHFMKENQDSRDTTKSHFMKENQDSRDTTKSQPTVREVKGIINFIFLIL